jgi:putative aldouronate transport system substrate-binding protein
MTRHRVVAVIAALCLALCAAAPAALAIETKDWMVPYENTVVLTTGKSSVSDPSFPIATDSQADNSMTRAIKEALNIQVDLAWESSEYQSKLALQITAGDLPDFFMLGGGDYRVFRQLVDNGMLADLSGYYPSATSDYIDSVLESYDYASVAALTEPDGALYAIGAPQYYYDGHSMLWLRKDWLDALGLAEPKTIDELETVLVAFRDSYGSIGLPLTSFGGYNTLHSFWAICGAFGAFPSMWVGAEDGTAVYGSVAPQMKDALTLLARWYDEGLIAKEFPTMDNNMCAAAFNTGETGALFGPWWLGFNISDVTGVEGADVTIVNAPLDSSGKYNIAGPASFGSMLCVSAKCENPDAVIKMLNFEFEAFQLRLPEYYDEMRAVLDAKTNWTALFPTGGVNFGRSDNLLLSRQAALEIVENGGIINPDDYTSNQINNGTFAANYQSGADTSPTAWTYYQGYLKAAALFQAPEANLVKPLFSVSTESMEDYWASLKTLEDTTLLSIVIGDKPVDSFDAFASQWYAQGGLEITGEVNDSLAR